MRVKFVRQEFCEKGYKYMCAGMFYLLLYLLKTALGMPFSNILLSNPIILERTDYF